MITSATVNKLNAWEVNKYAIQLYKKYFTQIIIIGCADSIFTLLFNLQTKPSSIHNTNITPVLFSIYIILPLISVLLEIILLWFLDQREQGVTLSIVTSFQQVLPRFIYVVVAQFFVTLIVSAGLFLLIIPGLIWGLMFSQVETFLILKKQRVREAFTSSKQITKGNLWLIARSYLILYLPLIILYFLFDYVVIPKTMPSFELIFSFIWGLFTSQWGILITYCIWRSLIKDSASLSTSVTQ